MSKQQCHNSKFKFTTESRCMVCALFVFLFWKWWAKHLSRIDSFKYTTLRAFSSKCAHLMKGNMRTLKKNVMLFNLKRHCWETLELFTHFSLFILSIVHRWSKTASTARDSNCCKRRKWKLKKGKRSSHRIHKHHSLQMSSLPWRMMSIKKNIMRFFLLVFVCYSSR